MPDTTNNMAMLAILNAWLDRKKQALDCCERMQHCSLPKLAPMPERQEEMRVLGRNLANAIIADNARSFLEEAIEKQRAQ